MELLVVLVELLLFVICEVLSLVNSLMLLHQVLRLMLNLVLSPMYCLIILSQ